eukprot:383161-Pleurochrysis_carterae.AAC.1
MAVEATRVGLAVKKEAGTERAPRPAPEGAYGLARESESPHRPAQDVPSPRVSAKESCASSRLTRNGDLMIAHGRKKKNLTRMRS